MKAPQSGAFSWSRRLPETVSPRIRWSEVAPGSDAWAQKGAAGYPAKESAGREHGAPGLRASTPGDVGALPRIDESVHDPAQPLVVHRAQRRLLALLRKPRVDGPAGALERAVDRRRGRIEHLGRLPRREAEHLAEDEHGALPGREVLK